MGFRVGFSSIMASIQKRINQAQHDSAAYRAAQRLLLRCGLLDSTRVVAYCQDLNGSSKSPSRVVSIEGVPSQAIFADAWRKCGEPHSQYYRTTVASICESDPMALSQFMGPLEKSKVRK